MAIFTEPIKALAIFTKSTKPIYTYLCYSTMRILRIASIAAAIGSLITACVFGKTKTIDPSQSTAAAKVSTTFN